MNKNKPASPQVCFLLVSREVSRSMYGDFTALYSRYPLPWQSSEAKTTQMSDHKSA